MEAGKNRLHEFMMGADKRFVIPVYQRNYDWKRENCKRLFDDLARVASEDLPSHFFGSIVYYYVATPTSKTEYQIIDGQQRLTTVSLFLLALKRLLDEGKITSTDSLLPQRIQEYLVDQYAPDETRVKLKPVQGDDEAFARLFDAQESKVEGAKVTDNYRYFLELIEMSGLTADDLYKAFQRLEFVFVKVVLEDKPQLIFETINSTGVGLTEGDKIRNYVLMDLKSDEQAKLFKKYWQPIEELTDRGAEKDGVGLFIRDLLTMETGTIPNLDGTYAAFKRYCAADVDWPVDRAKALEKIKAYAETFRLMLHPEEIADAGVSWRMFNVNRQEVTSAYPFLLRVLHEYRLNQMSKEEICAVLAIVDVYVFRRQMCNLPTNALNKVFSDLDNSIRNIGIKAPYPELMAYTLSCRHGNARLPNDDEFRVGMVEKHVYDMNTKNRAYLFARLEHGNSKDAPVHKCSDVVWDKINAKEYTIEHVMPQTPTPAWKDELGENWAEVRNTWLHRLANLTLTAYNTELSNKSFGEKSGRSFGTLKDKVISYVASAHHIGLNGFIAAQEHWRLEQLEARAAALADEALQIWPMPCYSFEPPKATTYSYSLLECEDSSLFTGTKPVGFTLLGETFPVATWRDVAEKACRKIFSVKPAELAALAVAQDVVSGLLHKLKTEDPGNYSVQIDGHLYLEPLGSAWDHCQFLRHLIHTLDVGDLVLQFNKEVDDFVIPDGDGDADDLPVPSWKVLLSFWTAFNEFAQADEAFMAEFKLRKPKRYCFYDFGIGHSTHVVCMRATTMKGVIQCGIYVKNSMPIYDAFLAHSEEIEKSVGSKIEWGKAKMDCTIMAVKEFDVKSSQGEWPTAFKWLCETAIRFKQVDEKFGPKD